MGKYPIFARMARNKELPEFDSLMVTGAGSRGKAIAKAPDGRVVFLTGAVPGDTVKARAYKKRKGYFEARVTEILEPSPDRIKPECAHFGVCGGCKWQHMAYGAQLRHKQQEVLENLRRIGKLELPEPDPILPAPEPYFYRNKMEFSFSSSRWLEPEEIGKAGEIGDRSGLGLHIPGMWDKVLDLKECHLQAPPSDRIRTGVRDFARERGISFFNPRSQRGALRTLMIRNTSGGDFMVLVQFCDATGSERHAVLDYLRDTFPEIKSLYYTVNRKANDSLYDLDLTLYHGDPDITETMEHLRFRITPKSFYQTNARQAYALYRKVREMAAIEPHERVYDLYTGLGTIAQFVAGQALEVIGIEAVPEAIEAARASTAENGLANTRFFAGDMKALFTREFLDRNGHPDVLITDPPRDGMHGEVVARILEIAPRRVVYVSCNSATQARDLALMQDQYRIVRVQPVDMFPQTHHVENIVLLHHRNMP